MVAKQKATAKKDGTPKDSTRGLLYNEFLDVFYQVHYRLGMNLEEAMCDSTVSRAQAAVLSLLASEIGEGGVIRRKEVERLLSEWFETSNSNVSKLLRDLTKAPTAFIEQKESPHSGREKVVSLTPQGLLFIKNMKNRGFEYFEEALAHMSIDEMERGAVFFKVLFSKPLPKRKTDTLPPRRAGSPARRNRG